MKNMKNILVCSADYAIGATGAFHFARFIRDLNGQTDRYRVYLVTEDTADGTPHELPETDPSTLLKVKISYPPRLFFLGLFIRNWAYFRAIQRFRKENEVAAIVFNQAMMGVLSRWLLPRRIPIIHDDSSLLPDRSAHKSVKAYWYQVLIQGSLEKLALRSLDVLLANSDYILNVVLTKYPSLKIKTQRLYQSIDVRKLPFSPKNWSSETLNSDLKNDPNTEGGISTNRSSSFTIHHSPFTIKVLFVKLGYVRGGLEDLVAALGLLKDNEFELTVVGTIPSSFPIIESWTNPFSNIKLQLLGLKNQQEVSELMQKHHILCIPARREALGLANVEGLAHGISVVSTTAGGIPEVLDFGKCGWLAAPKNPISLAEALKNCIESTPSVKIAKSQHGRAYVEQYFSKEAMLKDMLNLFEGLKL
jgi:colanic acid/amylovoran biosynthesis glycosyltransferase